MADFIEEIVYKKKKYPVRIGYRAFKGFRNEVGKDFDEVDKTDFSNFEPLLYHALVAGHKAEEKEMPFTREQMEDVLDECLFDFISLIPKFIPEHMRGKITEAREGSEGNAKPSQESPQ